MKIFQALLPLLLLLSACSHRGQEIRSSAPPLVSLNIIDRNGFSETITSPERLEEYDAANFLGTQPYQKVLRIYQRDALGDVRACITSYHPNGQVKQYIDIVNGRAMGKYQEWYADGTMKIEASVIGGDADLHTAAEQSWLFDGVCRSWEDEGQLTAEISYAKGVLDGCSLYYHPNGKIWKRAPFCRGVLDGVHETYYNDGSLLQQVEYVGGIRQGKAMRYWHCPEGLAAEECYENDLLQEGLYRDKQGKEVARIHAGEGFRALFNREGVAELQEYRQGIPEGLIQRFNSHGNLVGKYSIQDGVKHGEEIEFFPLTTPLKKEQPQLLITWYEGKIQGMVKTWYPNGVQESQREMSNNIKNGIAMAWYRDGNLMLLEEYAQDHLMKGEYFPKGEQHAISTIRDGSGIATLYNADGTFLQKVSYRNGVPFD